MGAHNTVTPSILDIDHKVDRGVVESNSHRCRGIAYSLQRQPAGPVLAKAKREFVNRQAACDLQRWLAILKACRWAKEVSATPNYEEIDDRQRE